MSTDLSRSLASFMGGGGVRTDILDPSILSFSADGFVGRYSSSSKGTLAASSEAFWTYLGPRIACRVGSHHGKGFIAQREHENFSTFEEHEQAISFDMIPEEKVEELNNPKTSLRAFGQVPFNMKIYDQMQQRVPQFFLRNIKRLEKDTTLGGSAFRNEIWRDEDEYRLEIGPDQVLTYERPEFEKETASSILEEEIRLQHEVLVELDWHTYHGRWREGVTRMAFFLKFDFLFERQKIKGRFATEEEKKAEEVAEQRRLANLHQGKSELESRDQARQAEHQQKVESSSPKPPPPPKPQTQERKPLAPGEERVIRVEKDDSPHLQALPEYLRKMLGLD